MADEEIQDELKKLAKNLMILKKLTIQFVKSS